MPKIAVFPKAYMDDLCVNGSMSVEDWLDVAAQLDVDGWSGMLALLKIKIKPNGSCLSLWPRTGV